MYTSKNPELVISVALYQLRLVVFLKYAGRDTSGYLYMLTLVFFVDFSDQILEVHFCLFMFPMMFCGVRNVMIGGLCSQHFDSKCGAYVVFECILVLSQIIGFGECFFWVWKLVI
eukprot:TRINITY_DN4359_c0_g1_i17.p2 TRINITY_DN4359_c0_g1~~TRINITY_DN4359_c0_g1_i17.p2  ORF type:complete len:115 (+),score=6.32 TRINITY_DN4359_c0_g1_i17:435-779(+)